MRLKQNIAIAFLSASFLLNFTGISSYAAAVSEQGNKTSTNGFIVEELSPEDLSNVDPSNIIELPQSKTAMLSENDISSSELSSDLKVPDFSLSDLEKAKSLDDSLVGDGAQSRTTKAYEIANISDVLLPDTTSSAYTLSIANGQILQVELQVPKNLSLNYDLYLLAVNTAGELTVVSGSEYATDSSYMPESAGAINNSGSTLTYVILVDSKGNPSTTDYFTINASIGNTYDSFEPNESAFFSIDFPNITDSNILTVTGNINTPIDNDWFSLYIENTSSFAGIEIANTPGSMIVESYTVSGGNQMRKSGSTSNSSVLPIVKGYNYFRIVSNRQGAFTPENYSIEFKPALNATKMVTYIVVNGYCQRTSNLFTDGLTRFIFERKSPVEVQTRYYSGNNIPTKASDTIDVEIENPAWDAALMKYERGSNTVENSYTCSAFLNTPVLRGDRLDFVYTTITSKKFGVVANRVQMALLNKYDDGELNRPCRHNGACGFN